MQLNEMSINDPLVFTVANHVSAMLAYWDKDLICRYANSAYSDWFGKTSEEMIDQITIQELLGPIYEKNLPYIQKALAGETQMFEREIQTPSSGVRYSLANYFPDIINGEVVGFIAHVTDITPIKSMEIELIRSNTIISEQNDRLTNFANIVSHNLGNYAQNFESISNLLLDDNSEEMKKELFNELKVFSENFRETIKSLNMVVSVQNLTHFNLVKVNLYDYIIKVIAALQIQIDSSNTIIKNNIEKDVHIMGIPAYIESILINFLTNSIKYKHPDRDPIIILSCNSDENYITIKISDNGRGINLQKHSKNLFKLYKTFHGNADARGVGLYITKYQIETMGGKIEVESEENIGTTFYIRLQRG